MPALELEVAKTFGRAADAADDFTKDHIIINSIYEKLQTCV